jgi:hypothetical protein
LFIDKILLNIDFAYDIILCGGVIMRSKATKFLSSALLGVLIFTAASDAVLLVTSPYWADWLYKTGYLRIFGGSLGTVTIQMPFHSELFMMIFVALSGIVLGALLVENIRLIVNVRKGNPFCVRNATAFRLSAWCCTAQFGIFIAKMIEGPTILTLGCTLIFLLAAMLYFVLADLFHSAALLREDNDLTI